MSLVTMAPCSLHLSGSSHFILCWPIKIKTKSHPYLHLFDGCGVCIATWTLVFASRSICDGDRGHFVISSSAIRHTSTRCVLVFWVSLGHWVAAESWGSSRRPRVLLHHLPGNIGFSVPPPRTSLFCPVMVFYKRHINFPHRRMS